MKDSIDSLERQIVDLLKKDGDGQSAHMIYSGILSEGITFKDVNAALAKLIQLEWITYEKGTYSLKR
jgi:hypothetical protein